MVIETWDPASSSQRVAWIGRRRMHGATMTGAHMGACPIFMRAIDTSNQMLMQAVRVLSWHQG